MKSVVIWLQANLEKLSMLWSLIFPVIQAKSVFTTMKKKYFIVTCKRRNSKKLFLPLLFSPIWRHLLRHLQTRQEPSLVYSSTYFVTGTSQQRLLSFEMCKYANWFPNFFGVFLHNLIWNILSRLIIRSHYYYFSIINFIGKNNLPEASNYILYHF